MVWSTCLVATLETCQYTTAYKKSGLKGVDPEETTVGPRPAISCIRQTVSVFISQRSDRHFVKMHLSIAVAAVFAAIPLGTCLKVSKAQPSNVVEGAYLIQLTPGSALSGRDLRVHDSSAHDAFHKRAVTLDLNCEQYTHYHPNY